MLTLGLVVSAGGVVVKGAMLEKGEFPAAL
jgi:hypothetical protein